MTQADTMSKQWPKKQVCMHVMALSCGHLSKVASMLPDTLCLCLPDHMTHVVEGLKCIDDGLSSFEAQMANQSSNGTNRCCGWSERLQ